jgi:hypothetical protein
VSFVVKASLFPDGAVPKAPDAVSQVHNLEVYKQSERFATQLEVGEIAVHGIGFDDDEIFDPQVDPASRHHRHRQTGLSRTTHPDFLEFVLKTNGNSPVTQHHAQVATRIAAVLIAG